MPLAHTNPQGDGGDLLHRLWIYTNYDCNLSCSYCVAESFVGAERNGLTLPQVCRLIDEAVEIGMTEIFFTGGEPFILHDIFTMLGYGGASGLFLPLICRATGIRQLVIPNDAAVFSAYGLLWSDAVRSMVQTVNWIVPASPLEPVNQVLSGLAAQASEAVSVASSRRRKSVRQRLPGIAAIVRDADLERRWCRVRAELLPAEGGPADVHRAEEGARSGVVSPDLLLV